MVELPPRLEIAALPTPIRALSRPGPDAPHLWVKHDDDTGGIWSGNKIRKLQYLGQQALASGVDLLITCGGLQSNHCRATAAVACRLGMDVALVLRDTNGEAGGPASGNLLLDRWLGADVHLVDAEGYADREARMAAIAETARGEGRTAMVIGEGASIPYGCWGYVEAMLEVASWEALHEMSFDCIAHAVGSGGTTAGLLVGAAALKHPGRILGFAVCDDAAHFHGLITDLVAAFLEGPGKALGVTVEDAMSRLELDDRYIGEGYGIPSPPQLTTMAEAARRDALVLDPSYTGKAFHGLRSRIAAGAHEPHERILFLHTGGIYGLLAGFQPPDPT